MMRSTLAILTVLLCTWCVGQETARAATPHHFFAGALSYAWPQGELADSTGANASLGLSLGYLYRVRTQMHVGVKGTWTRMTLGKTAAYDYSDYGLTHVGIYATTMYRLRSNSIEPYVSVDAGMGLIFADEVVANQPIKIDGLNEVSLSVGVTAGILVPISEVMDADVSGRWFRTYTFDQISMLGVQAGIVYALR